MLYCRCKEDFFGYCLNSVSQMLNNGTSVPVYKSQCPKEIVKAFQIDCPDFLPNSVVNPSTVIEQKSKSKSNKVEWC